MQTLTYLTFAVPTETTDISRILIDEHNHKATNLVACNGLDKIGQLYAVTAVYVPRMPDMNYPFTGRTYYGSLANITSALEKLYNEVGRPLPNLVNAKTLLVEEVDIVSLAVSLGINPKNADVLKHANSKLKSV